MLQHLIVGEGPITLSFNDVRVIGDVEMNTINGGYLNLNKIVFSINVGSCDASLQGFGVFLDGTISSLLSNSLPSLINESSNGINEIIAENLLPIANDFLNQYRLVDVVLLLVRERLAQNVDVV